ncbi:MAG TPA: Wzz/FepE/Etk N-terminal domain-containing protein [Candidatus Hydrogenedentes bacterium]|nr:Wzz/FepE/Etk N-terminal domain-containing protein [Candidatus Hydrogenedentota bacterium]
MSEERKDQSGIVIPLSYVKIVREVWSRRWLIVAATIVCMLAGTAVAFLLPATYESSSVLVLMPTPFKQAGGEASALIPRVLAVSDYEILLSSDGVLKQVAEKIKTLGTWSQEDLLAVEEISNLRNQMNTEVEITEKTVQGVVRSPVVVLKARANTPEHARDLAQVWAAVSEEVANKLYQKGKSGLKDFVTGRFDTAKLGLEDIRGKIRDLEIEYNDELEHERLTKKHERLISYEEKLIDLNMQIASTKAEIADLQENFSKEPERKTLWKSPPMTAVFLDKNREGGKASSSDSEKKSGFQEEVLNDTYIYLQQKLLLKESELMSMEEHARQLQNQMESLGKELQELRADIAQRMFERKQLDLQEGPLKKSYDLLAEKLEQAKIAESEEASMPDIKQITEAVLPDRKIKPMRSLIPGLALAVGFCLSTGAVILRSMLAGIF